MTYRSLGWFWAAVFVVLAVGGGVLQWLGPPERARTAAAGAVRGRVSADPPASDHSTPDHPTPGHPASDHPAPGRPAPAGATPGHPAPAGAAPGHPPPDAQAPAVRASLDAIAPPDPALLDATPGPGGAPLPQIAPDGRRPMQVYAGRTDRTDTRPRIALVLADLGLAEDASREAIESLPSPVTLAVSAYAPISVPLLDLARAKGHELLATIPMESQGYPLNDAGPLSLLTGAAPEANARSVDTALSRFTGYAGATAVTNGLLGDRFAGFGSGLAEVRGTLSRRGLLYIDPRPGAAVPAGLAARAVDVVVDASPTRAEIEARLAELEQIARQRGSALGLASPIRPVTVERLVGWARGLGARGIVLVPASALVPMPPAPAPDANPQAAPGGAPSSRTEH